MKDSTSIDAVAIFLDCDGVLNADCHGSAQSAALSESGNLEREMVRNLGKLAKELAKQGLVVRVVVSSSWRHSPSLYSALRRALADEKLEPFSETPDLRSR